MPNPHGFPIWYELRTDDPDAAKRFYDDAVRWTIDARPEGEIDYRMIVAPDGNVGGVMRLLPEMRDRGAGPEWRVYFGVDNVDAAAAKAREAGGAVHIEPFDMPGVGRMAIAADPQGIPFTLMRGAVEGATSTAFSNTGNGHCSWNELASPDPDAAKAFYGTVLGWTFPHSMSMGEAGQYSFIHVGNQVIGGLMRAVAAPAGWLFYWGVDEIGAALNRVTAGGGFVGHGPTEVPGGAWTLVATDPEGVRFGLVGPYENDVE